MKRQISIRYANDDGVYIQGLFVMDDDDLAGLITVLEADHNLTWQ